MTTTKRNREAGVPIDPTIESKVAFALWGVFESVNEADRNGENANVVDGLFSIARAIHHVARALEGVATEEEHDRLHDGPRPIRAPIDAAFATIRRETGISTASAETETGS